MGLTISKQDNIINEDSTEILKDPYNNGIDINQLSEKDKIKILSILKEEFKKT